MISLKNDEKSASEKMVDWGRRASDWASLQEPLSVPLFSDIISCISMNGVPMSLLDIGCGSGVLCKMAYDKGFKITGLDAAPEMLKEAEKRVPQGSFYEGDMESLPFDNETFDVVTAVTSIHIANNPANAVREAARVLKKGGQFFHAIWGPPQECETGVIIAAFKDLMPPPGPNSPGPLYLDGALEKFISENGLKPEQRFSIRFPWEYKNREHIIKANLSAILSMLDAKQIDEENAGKIMGNALLPLEKKDGTYSLNNTFIYVKAGK